jgi:ubiquinone/menaquinone biosynthesis C-methylase UbiE
MLNDYKRRQMEFEDREFPRYSREPIVLAPAFQIYAERQCAIALSTIEKAGIEPLRSVLVCGVGAGEDLEYWLTHLRADSYTAMDFSIEAIRATQRRLAFHNCQRPVDYVKADIEDLPLADSSVDLVIGTQVLHHMSAPGQACREMFRVAKKGVLLLEPADTLSTRFFKRVGMAQTTEVVGNTVLRFKKADFVSYLGEGDYSLTSRTYFFYYHPVVLRALTGLSALPGSRTLARLLCPVADICLFPLRSKCVVMIQKGPLD